MELVLSVPLAWKPKLKLRADTPGVVVVMADWNDAPFGLAHHRVTIKRRGPPPNLGMNLKCMVNGQVVTGPPGPTVKEGEPVKYDWELSNTGNVPFSDVSLQPSCTERPVGPNGDNGNGMLDPGETWSWSVNTTALLGTQLCNTVASGTYDNEASEVRGTCAYTGVDKPVEGPRHVFIIEETQNRDPAYAALWIGLAKVAETSLAEHRILRLDKDAKDSSGASYDGIKPYLSKIQQDNIKMPAIFIIDPDGGDVLYSGQCPKKLSDLIDLLAEHGAN